MDTLQGPLPMLNLVNPVSEVNLLEMVQKVFLITCLDVASLARN